MSEIYLGKDEIYIFLKRDTQRDHNLAWYTNLIKLKNIYKQTFIN